MEENKAAGYCALGEPLQIGKIYFCPEEVVFCPAYKSRHITAPQAKARYKTSNTQVLKSPQTGDQTPFYILH